MTSQTVSLLPRDPAVQTTPQPATAGSAASASLSITPTPVDDSAKDLANLKKDEAQLQQANAEIENYEKLFAASADKRELARKERAALDAKYKTALEALRNHLSSIDTILEVLLKCSGIEYTEETHKQQVNELLALRRQRDLADADIQKLEGSLAEIQSILRDKRRRVLKITRVQDEIRGGCHLSVALRRLKDNQFSLFKSAEDRAAVATVYQSLSSITAHDGNIGPWNMDADVAKRLFAPLKGDALHLVTSLLKTPFEKQTNAQTLPALFDFLAAHQPYMREYLFNNMEALYQFANPKPPTALVSNEPSSTSTEKKSS